tara:strand:- start:1281 stop:2294 length:1014 start_codon:yes stop_codon:yes gene_type:complete
MALPKQVQKQSEEVQALYKELNEEPTEAQAAPAEATEEVPVEQPEQEVSDSEIEQAPKSEANEQTASDTQAKEDWQQKYRSLQGMYNADVPRLNSENRNLTSRVDQLEQLLSTTQNTPLTPEIPSVEKLITEDDEKEYGDSIDIMRKAAKEEVAQANTRVAQLEAQIRQLQNVVPKVDQVQKQQQQTSQQAFWAKLSSEVPHWNEVNEHPDFQSWLLEIDPLTGISRQTYLEDAQKQLDASRVVNFFKTWEQANGKPNAQPNRKAQNSQLQKQVAPGRSRSNGAAVSGEPPTYTPEDIKKFFADVRQGKFKGRDDERGRIERDIFAAQTEGRIVTAN